MKKLELPPTDDNIRDTFNEDVLNRSQDVIMFAAMLNSFDTNSTVAVDGNWGEGKTFFVKQTKMVLDAIGNSDAGQFSDIKSKWEKVTGRDFPSTSFRTVYYDSWLFDDAEDPMLSLVWSIINNGESEGELAGNTDFIKIATTIFDFFSGMKSEKFLDALKSPSPLESIENQMNVRKNIKQFLDQMLVEHANRMVIFVDELDRCRPDYAVRLLERIKHYFDDDRITFVFSVNMEQLVHTIRTFYGSHFDAGLYLNRFFDIPFPLPPYDFEKVLYSAGFSKDSKTYYSICYEIMQMYNMSLRDRFRFITIANEVFADDYWDRRDVIFERNNTLRTLQTVFVPLLIGLELNDKEGFQKFKDGQDSKPLVDLSQKENTQMVLRTALLEDLRNSDLELDKDSVYGDCIEEMYKAIFSGDDGREKKVGSLLIRSKTKEKLLRATAGLSGNARYLSEQSEE